MSSHLPKPVINSEKFLFYFHGGVVTVLGNNAINQSVPEWGPYEYRNILDSLHLHGFNVISENRKPDVENKVYANKLVSQIDSLLKRGVSTKQILVVGASAGWEIVLQAAAMLKNPSLNYVIMGGCWTETYKDFQKLELFGHFLSIIEKTDPHSTCIKIFEFRKTISSFKEVVLNTGLSHGFFYKGRKDWILPILDWYTNKNAAAY